MQLWWLDLAPNSSLCSWPLDLAIRQARLPLDRYGAGLAGLPEIPAMIEGRAWSGPTGPQGPCSFGGKWRDHPLAMRARLAVPGAGT